MPCIPKEGCSGAMPIFRWSGRSEATNVSNIADHKSTGTIFFAPRCLSDFHHGTVHKPVAVKKDALTLPNARAAVATEWDMWKNLRAYDVRSSATSEEGREICSFSIRHEPLPSETLRACSNIPKHTRRESCAKGHGCRAAFAVQGASASQLAAARLTDTLARHPGMAVEANDAVSACKQVHVSEARRLLRLPEKECPHEWMGLRPSRGPKMSDSIEESVVLLEQNLCGHPLAGMLWEGNFVERCSSNTGNKYHLGMTSRPPTFTTVLVRKCGLQEDVWKEHVGPMWKKSVKKKST